MSIALRNIQGTHTPIRRIQEDGNFRMLLVICGLITAPSLALAVFLTGWVQYVFTLVVAVNVAVPVLAYFSSLDPGHPAPEEEFGISRAPQLTFGGAGLPQAEQETVSDQA